MDAPRSGQPEPLRRAALERDGDTLRSRDFGDVYFSMADGLRETQHVFLRHNGLPERWSTNRPGGRSAQRQFTIGELGFGSGLNFAATWCRFLESAPSNATLDYISVEGWPLSVDDQREALKPWPELARPAAALTEQAATWARGFNLRVFESGRVRLLLLVGEVTPMLAALSAEVDAWYLDGFAPAKNAAMWTPDVFAQLVRSSAPGATFATYTAAGQVRRDLDAAGFDVERVDGFGTKRDMLRGRLRSGGEAPQRIARRLPEIPPWFERPPALTARRVAVVGTGLAGASTARALAERGLDVTVIAPEPSSSGQIASRAPAMTVRPWPERADRPLSRFYERAFDFIAAQRRASSTDARWEALHWNGIDIDPETAKVPRAGGSDPESAGSRAEPLRWPGGWLDPAAWRAALLAHPNIERHDAQVAALTPDAAGWSVALGDGGRVSVDAAVVATGAATLPPPLTRDGRAWAIEPASGQLTTFDGSDVPAGERTRCYGGHAIPRPSGWVLGSSFRRGRDDVTPSDEEERDYVESFAARASDLAGPLRDVVGRHFVAVRATVADHLPLLGPVVDADAFEAAYASLEHGRRGQLFPPTPYRAGLLVNAGHGSRGATATPLAAEIVVATLLGTPLPIESDVWCAVHPNRFLARAWRRR